MLKQKRKQVLLLNFLQSIRNINPTKNFVIIYVLFLVLIFSAMFPHIKKFLIFRSFQMKLHRKNCASVILISDYEISEHNQQKFVSFLRNF